MNSIQQAAALNNQGAEQLLQGQSRAATKSFQKALSVLKDSVHDDAVDWSSIDETTTSKILQQEASPFYESSTVPGLQTTGSYVYDHAIFIGDTIQQDSDEAVSLYSAVALFNLALLSHRRGVIGHVRAFKEATKLYRMSLQLLSFSGTTNKSFETALILVTLNNKAHAHYELCDYENSSDCLKEVAETIDESKACLDSLRREDLEGILGNTVFLTRPSAAHAA